MNELKKRALLAKQRMKMGYWQQMLQQREEMIARAGKNEAAVHKVNEVVREEIKREVNIVVGCINAGRDEILYKKVKEILNGSEIVSNPIGRLIDTEEYNTLDENGKQRYVLELSAKYRELKERYYKEQLAT